MEVADGQVADLVKRLRLPAEWRAGLAELASTLEDDRERLRKKERRLKRALANVEDLFKWDHIDQTRYLAERAELERELAALKPPESRALEAAARELETFADVWAIASAERRQEVVQQLFVEIFVDIEEGQVVSVRPRGAFFPLLRSILEEDDEREGCLCVVAP
jgi:hypothetical protein